MCSTNKISNTIQLDWALREGMKEGRKEERSELVSTEAKDDMHAYLPHDLSIAQKREFFHCTFTATSITPKKQASYNHAHM